MSDPSRSALFIGGLPPVDHAQASVRGSARFTSLLALCALLFAACALPFAVHAAAVSDSPVYHLLSTIFSSTFSASNAPIVNPPAPALVTYYSQGSLAPESTTSWNSLPGGGGATPPDFTSGDIFVIQNGHNMTTVGAWSISGSGSQLIIATGGTLTATGTVALASATFFQVQSGGTYVHNNTTAFGSSIFQATTKLLDANSNFIINASSTAGPSGVAFGNLTINYTTAPSGAVNCSGGITSIAGNLIVSSTQGLPFRLSGATPYTLTIGGNITISGNSNFDLTNGSGGGPFTVNIGGNFSQSGGATFTSSNSTTIATVAFTGGSSSATFGGSVVPTNINWQVASGKTLQLNGSFTVAASRSMTVASGGILVLNNVYVNTTSPSVATTTINGEFRIINGFVNGGNFIYGSGSTLSFAPTLGSFPVNPGSPYWPNANSPRNVTVMGLGITANGPQPSIPSTLTLTAGAVTSANFLTLGNGATISRDAGSLSGTPTFTTSVNVTYTGSTACNTGSEIPTSSSVLNVLTVSNTGGVTLGASATANGASSIGSGATLNTGAFALTVNSSLANSGGFNVNNNGTFAIGSAGLLTGTAPAYDSGSLLKYNSGGTYNRSLEWSSTSGAGYPVNVEINRRLDMGVGSPAVARQASGNLVVNSGGVLNLNGPAGSEMTAAVTILGNVTNGGDINLSVFAGGGLVVGGNLTNSLNFNHNGNTLTFGGASTQAWSDSNNQNFGNVAMSGSGGVQLNSDIALNDLTHSNGPLNILANTLSVTGNWTNTAGLQAGNSTVAFTGNGNTQTLSGSTTFNKLTINHAGGGGVTASGSTLTVSSLAWIQSGVFSSATQYAHVEIDPAGTLTLLGDIEVSALWTNDGTFNNGGFKVTFNGGSPQSISGSSTNAFAGLAVTNAAGLTINSNVSVSGTLGVTYASGTPTVNVASGTLTLSGTNPVTVTTTSALGAGDYTLISKSGSGSVAGTAPTNLTVDGSGLASGMLGSLQISGQQLVLHVQSSVGDVAVDISNSAIKKLNGADGTVAWSTAVSSDGSLALDQLDFGVYTGFGSQSVGLPGTVYKYNAIGGLVWTNTVSVSGGCNFNRVTGAAVDTTSSSPGVVWTQTGCGGGIAKSDRTTGVQQWSVFTNDISRPSIDPANGQIYATTVASCCTYDTIYSVTTAGAVSTSATSCEGSTDLNPADGMLYRGGNMGPNGCGLNLSQLNKSALATPNWSMTVPGITSFDALAVQPWIGGYIYVAAYSDSKIVVIDPATRTVVTSFATAVPPNVLAVNPEGGTLYLSNSASNFVYAYSPRGTLVWTSPNLGGPVYNLAAVRNLVGTAPTALKYRSKQTGNWSDTATWESSPNGSTWSAATTTPVSSDDTVEIQNTHTVTVTGDVTIDQMTVDSGSTLTVNSGVVLTIADGTNPDLANSGTVNITGTLSTWGLIANSNTLNVNGTFQINNGGSLSGTAPTYDYNSILKYNTGGSLGRGTEWTPGATSGAGVPGKVQISNNTAFDLPNGTTTSTFKAQQTLTIDSGSSFSMGAMTQTLTIQALDNSGTMSLSTVAGGDFVCGGFFTNNGTFNHNDRTTTFSGGAAIFPIGGDVTFGSFVNNATLTQWATNINITGNWTNNANFVANSRRVTFNGANNTQTISGGTTFANLTINHTGSGNVTLNSATTVATGLTLTSGKVITTSSNTLTISSAAASAISGGSASSYISGPLNRNVNATGSGTYTFPLGKGTYNPFEMINPSTTGSIQVQAEVFDADSGGTPGAGINSLNTNRYWSATQVSGSSFTTAVRLTESSLSISNVIGKSGTQTGTYSSIGGTVSGSTITSNSISSFSFFAIGAGSFSYRTRQSGNWNDFNTWEVNNGSGFVPAVSGQTPTSADDAIEIQSSHTVTVTANTSADQLTVDSGGTLAVNSGITLTIDNGTGTDLTVNGSANVSSTGVVGGTGTVAISGTLRVASSASPDAVGANVTASLTLNSGSTVEFNGAAAQSVGARTFDGLKLNNSNGASMTGSVTISGTLTLTSGTYQVGSNTLTLNGPPIAGTITNLAYSAGTQLIFGGNSTGVIMPGSTSSNVINVTTNNPNGVSLSGNITIIGTLTTNEPFNVGANTLDIVRSPSGNKLNTTSSSTISTGGNPVGDLIIPSSVTTLGELRVCRTNPTKLSGNLTVTTLKLNCGNFGIESNTLTIDDAIVTSSGSLTGGSASNITFTGSGASTTLPSVSGGLNNLTLNRANGISLGAPLTVAGTLTLTSGKITTTSTNVLTISNTSVGAISGGSSSAYINGPLARALPASLVSGNTYSFPVGKGTFNPFEMVNPTTSGTATIQAEVFDANSGGTAGTGLLSLNTNRYWTGTVTSGSFTNTKVRLTDSSVIATSKIGKSATQTGLYSSIGGTVSSSTITSDTITSFSFFNIGNGGDTISGTLFDAGGNPILDGRTIKLIQNGTVSGTTATTDNSGVYTFNALTLANGDRISVFIDGASEKGTTATVIGSSPPSSITNFDISASALRVRTDGGASTITNANLADLDSTHDADIPFAVTGGVLTTTNGTALQIDFSSSYTPGGAVNVGGPWTNSTGTFVNGGNTVTFNGTGAQTITTGGTGASKAFAGLVVNKASGTATLAGDLKAATLTVTSGTFDQGVSPGFGVSTTGAGTVATVGGSGTWNNFGTGDLTLSGDVSNSGTISFNANGTACNELATNDILIRSSAGGTQRTWSGTGTFSMIDVDVKDQKVPGGINPPIFILVNSGTDAAPGGTNTGWTFIDQCTSGTYTWIGGTAGANTDWTVGTNWNPTRAPASGDILLFDYNSTPAPLVTNIPTQTIAKLKFLNGVAATFNNSSVPAAVPQTLTVNGLTTDSLVVSTGSGITLDGSPTITLLLTSGSKADIQTSSGPTSGGQITLQGSAHRVLASAAHAITFANGANFTTQTGFTGSPFGDGSSQGTPQSVDFQGGSATFFHAGGDPFGVSSTPVTTFDSGSTETFFTATAFSYGNRTYGSLVLDGNQTYTGGSTTSPLTVLNNFTLQNGSAFTLSSGGGGDLNLLGNFTDNSTSAGAFNANGRAVNFNGGSTTQTISKASGAESFFDVFISETAGGKVQLLSAVTINGQMNLSTSDSLLELNAKTLTLNGTITGTGNLKGDYGATLSLTGTGALGTMNFISTGRTLSSLTMNRTSSGSAVVGNDLTVNSLTLTDGYVDMGLNTLTVNGAVSRTNGWIVGNEKRNFNCSIGSCAITFDVGTANGYSGVDESLSISQAGSYNQTIKAVQVKHPSISGTNALQRYWVLTSASGPTTATGNVTFHYLAGDVVGTESLYKIFKYNGSFTQFNPDVLNTSTHVATLNNFGSAGDWTLAEPGSVNPPTLGNYPATPVSVQLSGNTTVSPDAAPTNTTSINVSTSTNFKGKLEGDPTTGTVHVTDAHPAGTYTITVTAFNQGTGPTTKTFMLTVTTPTTCTPVSFGAAANFAVGTNPLSMAVGDFNRDGKQDLAIANQSTNNVSIRLGDGAGGFGALSNFTVGTAPVSVAVGDFNGDGKQDLATANENSNNVSILIGDGSGTFGSAINFSVGTQPLSVAAGDFNADSKPDLVVTNSGSNNVSILVGDGSGGFSAATNFTVGTSPYSVAVGDFNNNGKQDLAVANADSNNVSILLGDGSGGFGAATNFTVGTTPVSVAVGDFNGDSNQDLVVANVNSNNVSRLAGDGAGGFGTATNFTVGTQPRSVATGDFDGGNQDVVTANFSSNNVTTRSGDGAGGFGSAANFSVSNGPFSVAVGDFNGDGKQDLASANSSSNNVSVLLRQCQPTLSIDDVTHNEGNSSTTDYTFTVSLSSSSAQTVTVNFTDVTGSATTADGDYTSNSDSLSFSPGETSKTVTIAVNGDTKFEPTETFTVHLSGSTNASISDADGTGTITNDDSMPTVSIGDRTQAETNSGTTTFPFAVTLSNATASDVVISYSTVPGSANAGSDYVGVTNGPLTIPGGSLSGTIDITVNGDNIVEADETFSVHLNSASNTSSITDANGLGTITNDDSCPNPLTFTVNSNGDDPDTSAGDAHCDTDSNLGNGDQCTLRAAIEEANALTTCGTININFSGVSSPISLSTALPAINHNVNINGPGANLLTVQRTGVAQFRIFTINSGKVVSISGLTISGGNTTGSGGGILNSGTLTLTNSTVSGNNTPNAGLGGGILNSGTLTLTNSSVSGNNTASGGRGGGMYVSGGLVTLTNSSVSNNSADNSGGGIYLSGGSIMLTNSTVSGNVVVGNGGGGGILNSFGGSTVTLVGSTVSNNSAGSGAGGGIQNAAGTLTMTSTTVSGNTADSAGGIVNNGGVTMTNSTVSGNTANFFGGGIYNLGPLTLTNSTVSANTAGTNGGGIFRSGGTTNLKNTIVAGNTAGGSGNDLNGTFNSQGHNLIGKADGSSNGFMNGSNGDQVGTEAAPLNPMLSSLANNGGPTQTHALLPGSPAINAGDNCVVLASGSGGCLGTPLTTDQRGVGFARVVDTNVDIGAFESGGFTIAATGGTPQHATITTAFSSPLVATVTSNVLPAEPVAGGQVTFTVVPINGASGTFPGSVMTTNVAINSSGVATSPTFTANGTAGGPYSVTASANGLASSAMFSLTNAQATTATSVTSSVNPSDFGENVTFTATVSSSIGTPSGTVQFKNDGSAITCSNTGSQTPALISGVATCQISTLSAGTHTNFTADYSGDGNFNVSTGTLSGGQTVRGQPSLTINDVSMTEGDSGTKTFTFTVTLSAASNLTVTVKFGTANGTTNPATAGSDYVAVTPTPGTLTFDPGVTTQPITVTVNGDQSFEPNETFFVNLSSATSATISDNQGLGTIVNDDAQGGIISFSQSSYSVGESGGSILITVNRTGDTTAAASVDYATSDGTASLAPCSTANGLASSRCDFTTALGSLGFGAGETSKTFTVLISQDNYVEGPVPETLTLNLSNLTGGAVFGVNASATLAIADDLSEPATSPVDDARAFVIQHYHDFLNREPDQEGLDFWTNQITSCGSDAGCTEVRRINVSASFFLSIEFQQTGYLVERMYKVAYGDATGDSTFNSVHTLSVPIVRLNEFLADTQRIGKGVVVLQPGWELLLESNKQAYAQEFVQTSRFTAANAFPTTMTPAEFVNKLNVNAGSVLSDSERATAVNLFGVAGDTSNTTARAQALRQVAEDPDLASAEFNRAFVLMQYYGYLRRNPFDPQDKDHTGYDFWLTKLNQFNGNYINAEMVKAFITSIEYRQRFGP